LANRASSHQACSAREVWVGSTTAWVRVINARPTPLLGPQIFRRPMDVVGAVGMTALEKLTILRTAVQKGAPLPLRARTG
jgi:hypothetical protein